MSEWESDDEPDELAALLGADNTFGYHIEVFGLTSLFWDSPRRGDGTRFPCIDAENIYSGCLGRDCPSETCWSGDLVPSARHFRPESAALPSRERTGARCHTCRFAVDLPEGRVDCIHGFFDRPITPACLVRRRVPESAPIPCPSYQRSEELRPEVVELRRRKREQGIRRRQREAEAPGSGHEAVGVRTRARRSGGGSETGTRP